MEAVDGRENQVTVILTPRTSFNGCWSHMMNYQFLCCKFYREDLLTLIEGKRVGPLVW